MHLCAAGLLAQGYGVVRLNLRGVGPSAAYSRGPYHAGLTQDLRDVLSGLAVRFPKRPVAMIGFSLGGHMVLRLAGEAGQKGKPDTLAGVMSVCAPVDLHATQSRIAAPRNRIYHAALMHWMKRDARSWVACGTPLADKLETLRTVRDFDDALVAPAHGFEGAEDYYRRASMQTVASEICIPTLVLHSNDDPWIPLQSYHATQWPKRPDVTVMIARGGGHVGFHGRHAKRPWYVDLACQYLAILG